MSEGAAHMAGGGEACGSQGLKVLRAEAEGARYRGVIAIEWPAGAGSPYACMIGRLAAVSDAVSGKPILTCSGITVHVGVDELVTADLTLFAGEDGEPLFDGNPYLDGDEIRTAVFPFLVAEMRVRER